MREHGCLRGQPGGIRHTLGSETGLQNCTKKQREALQHSLRRIIVLVFLPRDGQISDQIFALEQQPNPQGNQPTPGIASGFVMKLRHGPVEIWFAKVDVRLD